jgi:hypothetical protein
MKPTRSLCVLVALLACSRSVQHERPDTALELCAQLAASVAPQLECFSVNDASTLTAFQAVEVAVLRRRGPDLKVPGTDKLTDIGWVSYRAEPEGSLHQVLFAAARQAVALGPVLEASNDAALVDVLVLRGEVSAVGYERLKADVASLQRVASR